MKNRVIFLLRSPKTKEFFVGHCLTNSLMPIFRQHWSGDRNYTDECFTALKKEGLHPCLTVLEEVYATPVEAYRYVIAWTKIFVDAGYVNLNTGNLSCYIEDMMEDSVDVYEKNKDRNLEEICDCKACLVAHYNRNLCPYCSGDVPIKTKYPEKFYSEKESKDKALHIRLSEGEWEQIEKNARACDKTVSAYVREVARNMCVLDIDHTYLIEHTLKITSLRNAIFDLIFYIRKSGNYTPPDLEYILKKMDEIATLEGDFLDKYSSIYSKMRKMIARTVRQTVNEYLFKSAENKERKTKS